MVSNERNNMAQTKRAASILMNESIPMPGFPQIIVTRGFLYQWLKACGWPPCERGFGSMDYLVFGARVTAEPLTDETDRDYWLGQVRNDYMRAAA